MRLKKVSSEKLMRGKWDSKENENKMKVLDSRRKAGGELLKENLFKSPESPRATADLSLGN